MLYCLHLAIAIKEVEPTCSKTKTFIAKRCSAAGWEKISGVRSSIHSNSNDKKKRPILYSAVGRQPASQRRPRHSAAVADRARKEGHLRQRRSARRLMAAVRDASLGGIRHRQNEYEIRNCPAAQRSAEQPAQAQHRPVLHP